MNNIYSMTLDDANNIHTGFLCRVKLCRPDKLIHDGVISWHEDKTGIEDFSNGKVWICSKCGRQIVDFKKRDD